MPLVAHVMTVAAYVLVGGAVALSLPQHLPALEFTPGVQIGALVAVLGALIHVAVGRVVGERAVRSAVKRSETAQAELRGEFERSREEARRVLEAVETSMRSRRSEVADIGQVVSEVRVLQGLVDQLSGRGFVAARAAATVGGAARPRPAAPIAPAAAAPTAAAPGVGEIELLDIVREALRTNRVDLYLQPIVSLPQRKRRHYECFSRIRAANGAVVTPDRYLAMAEREGLIGAIDNMLLFRCVQLIRRNLRRNSNVILFVNISEHTLADARFLRDFVAFMAEHRDLADHLVFEFAQAHVGRQDETTLIEFERLARLGFRFSMDQVVDFDLAPDELGARHIRFVKLEAQRLLEARRAEGRAFDLAAAKPAFDRNGIDVIVEKIETEQILVELLEMPIDFGQGYLFGEPRISREG